MGREQLLDLAGHLDAAVRDHDEVVGNQLELGEDVRRQNDRDAVLCDGPHHRRHEVVSGDRIEGGHRLVEDEEPWPSGECQRRPRAVPAGRPSSVPALRFSGIRARRAAG